MLSSIAEWKAGRFNGNVLNPVCLSFCPLSPPPPTPPHLLYAIVLDDIFDI